MCIAIFLANFMLLLGKVSPIYTKTTVTCNVCEVLTVWN